VVRLQQLLAELRCIGDLWVPSTVSVCVLGPNYINITVFLPDIYQPYTHEIEHSCRKMPPKGNARVRKEKQDLRDQKYANEYHFEVLFECMSEIPVPHANFDRNPYPNPDPNLIVEPLTICAAQTALDKAMQDGGNNGLELAYMLDKLQASPLSYDLLILKFIANLAHLNVGIRCHRVGYTSWKKICRAQTKVLL